ncbi:MAG: DMT family transporter [Caldilineaceae bacterium]
MYISQGSPCQPRRVWGKFIVLGALRAAIPISLIVWAETQISSGLAGILNSTSPLFTMLIAHWLTEDDKLTTNKLLGVVLAMGGLVVLIGVDALRGLGTQVMAQIAMLGATCAYGFAAVYGRKFKGTPAVVATAGMLAGATFLILPLSLVLERPWQLTPDIASIGAILGLALLSTALAFIIWIRLILTAGPSNTSMVTFLIPITALSLGIFVLGEKLAWTSYIGLALILAGLAVSQATPFFQKTATNTFHIGNALQE